MILSKNNEKELDEYGKSLFDDIEVPKELDDKIKKRIDKTPIKKDKILNKRISKVLAVAIIFMFLFTIGVKYIKGFSAYASNIPIIKIAVEWIKGDSGTEYAKQNGYKEIKGTVINKDGYRLTINNIMFDEDRLVLSVIADGEKVKKLKSEKSNLTIDIKFNDFKEKGGFLQTNISKEKIKIRAEKIFKDKEVITFLKKNPKYITLNAKLMIRNDKESKVIKEFNDIKIPFKEENVLLSKKHFLNKEITSPHGVINFKKLTISPTRMKLDVKFDMDEGYLFTDFENLYLLDSKGNAYKPEGLVSTNPNENSRSFYFVPSIYFEEFKKLYIVFDGVWIGSKDNNINLNIKDSYPKKITYMNKEITFKKVIHKNENLVITLKLPRRLRVNSLDIDGFKGDSYKSFRENINNKNEPSINEFGF
ncbi:MAG: DUF4179 domain-containing protein [Firmicutes bacterium]|nr:DUF4179 domain-containing protein [Bacillota bacterium]